MADLRYHVASLVAVFLALGIGLFTGSAFLNFNALHDRNQGLAVNLEKQLYNLREEQKDLAEESETRRKEVSRYNDLANELLTVVSDDLLVGKKGALVSASEPGKELMRALQQTGIVFTSKTVLKDLPLNEVPVSVFVEDAVPGLSPAGIVAAYIQGGDYAGLVEALKKRQVVNMKGIYATPVDFVLLVNDSDLTWSWSPVEKEISSYFRDAGTKVIVARGSDSPGLRESDGKTIVVQEVDRPWGRWKLINTLAEVLEPGTPKKQDNGGE